MAQLPFAAYGDMLPVVKITDKFEGQGDSRHKIGVQVNSLLLFDNCASVPIVIPGLNAEALPSAEIVNERNLKMQFLVARFQDLVITFTGGDYGTIRYKGTATAIEFLNLTPAPTRPVNSPTK